MLSDDGVPISVSVTHPENTGPTPESAGNILL
jgi:hypothetical protein